MDLHRPGPGCLEELADSFPPSCTSGEGLIEEVRSRGFGGPIVVLTGVLDDKDAEHLMAIGADRVLQKPIRIAALLSTVELFLSPGVEEETSEP